MADSYDIRASLQTEVEKRILLLDGATGTMIQTYGLTEEDFRGESFRDVPGQIRGNNDILSLTRPDVIQDIHRRYLEVGVDIITANTFSSQRVSLADYHCESLVSEINRHAVRLAREVAEQYSTPDKPRFVVASVGPTNKTCSMSPDVNNPAFRAITYDELRSAYIEQMTALLEEGVDGILLETIFDTLNAKAGIDAAQTAMQETGHEVPLLLSVTVSDKAGRTLSGQTLEAFLASVQHARLFSVGLNCSFGAHDMLPCLRTLAQKAPYYISAHPNAGLPNTLGGYDQTPEIMLHEMQAFTDEGLVNIIGGCCGTTPEHLALLSTLTSARPHVPVPRPHNLWLSGLELLEVTPEVAFVNVGERCNVAGSRKFLRLIKEGAYDEALAIARHQVEDGALVLDINMDDGLLDARKEMVTFLNLLGSDPDICRVPVMIDSSDWQVIRSGLKCLQGKGIVNSISLKEGEAVFLSHATELKRLGAAAVVMAFDEQGQATTYERRIEVCRRAYNLLVDKVGFNPLDIIFDPNVLAVATGMPEHDSYALDFLRATEWIRHNLPGAHVSGGVSNLSFSFRGNNYIREAMHAVFLYHARLRGMDFGIVNPASKVMYSDIPQEQLQVIEDVLLHPSAEASERLIELAGSLHCEGKESPSREQEAAALPDVKSRLILALQRGISDNLEADLHEALRQYPHAVDIIEGPLMEGMNLVGSLFGEGKMFLPQVVKTARTMKRAVSILRPYIEAQRQQGQRSNGRVLVATVKGDVHDIGKNIVSVVMACNGYEIIDLGVMVPAEEIVRRTKELKPDIIGLSGLITPSLEEMINVVSLLRKEGIDIPVMIGGATTSRLHTALKIAPAYGGSVIWVKDASQNAPLASLFLNPATASQSAAALAREQESLRQQASAPQPAMLPLEEARKRKPHLS
ncbi:MAG: methionine synthase [Prevotellaceae bacterium]|nr:methionine synthase [Prevotellaceae bacterium]